MMLGGRAGAARALNCASAMSGSNNNEWSSAFIKWLQQSLLVKPGRCARQIKECFTVEIEQWFRGLLVFFLLKHASAR